MANSTTSNTLDISCFADILMSLGVGFGPVESCFWSLEEELEALELFWNFCLFLLLFDFFFS